MIASYREQVERLKEKLEQTDTSQVDFLDLQRDGTLLDTDTKIIYRNWAEVEKKLSGIALVDNIPDDEEINEGGADDCG